MASPGGHDASPRPGLIPARRVISAAEKKAMENWAMTRNVTDKVGPHDDLLGQFRYLGPRTISDWMRIFDQRNYEQST
jgi:hypothetical protein